MSNAKIDRIAKNKRVYIFIDAANIWSVIRSKQQMIDWQALKTFFIDKLEPSELKIFYYEAYPANGTRSYSLDGRHKFFTFLKKGLGFIVRNKELKRINDDSGAIVEKGNMDVELVIDAIHNIDNYDIVILLSGDSDFMSLLNYFKNREKKVYIFTSKNSVSSELRTGGHGYFDLRKINGIWGKDLFHRKRKDTLN